MSFAGWALGKSSASLEFLDERLTVRRPVSRFCALDKHLDYLRLGGGVALPS